MSGTLPASGIPSPASSTSPPASGIPPPESGIPLSASGKPPSLSGIPPVSGIPAHYWNSTPVWNPIMCLKSHPIPCLVSHPVPHQHHLAYSTLLPLAITTLIFPLTASYPMIWPLPAHHLELLPHATPTTLAIAIWPSCTLPSPSLPAIWPSLSQCPCPIWLPAISLLPHHPCHLALLPPAIPSLPCHLALLAPTPCTIFLPAIAPPAPTTPTLIWTSCPNPTKYHHQRSPPSKKEI